MKPSQPPVRKFLPADLKLDDWSRIHPVVDQLLARPIGSPPELEHWLADFSELYAAIDEHGARCYIEKSCHTDDADIERAFLHFVETIDPPFKQAFFDLQKKFIDCPHHVALTGQRYTILIRQWQADVELFRPENVDLETEATKLVNEYDKLNGRMMIEFRGQTYTPQQMARFIDNPDRATREAAWRAVVEVRLGHRQAFDEIFEQLLKIRQRIAANAGCANFRDYCFKRYKRFDYTPADCEQFADAVARAALPVVAEMDARRKRDLNLPALRPWDNSVDPKGRAALSPFDPKDIGSFVGKTRSMLERLSPSLAVDFDQLAGNDNLDLESRKGKQPGGYQSSLEESRQPFIFMNAAGRHADVRTLLHEAGHAFHYQWAVAGEPLVFLRAAPMEFCEVASMSMELLAMDHYDIFYGPGENFTRAKREQLEGCVTVLPWIALIDQFQHWIYTTPGHTRQQRTDKWLELARRFMSGLDWSGLEPALEAFWHKQMHLYHAPFYYIEYGIAQLGALQLWLKSRDDMHQAMSNYRAGLRLGGTETLPKLFAATGLQFDFSIKTVGPLMNAVKTELAELD